VLAALPVLAALAVLAALPVLAALAVLAALPVLPGLPVLTVSAGVRSAATATGRLRLVSRRHPGWRLR
jgi:hypothetical protein